MQAEYLFGWLTSRAPEKEMMQLEDVGVTQPVKHGPFQIRLKFGKQNYCVAEVSIGEEASEIAKKLREFAAQVEARSKVTSRRGLRGR
jgi:hypothetical protein